MGSYYLNKIIANPKLSHSLLVWAFLPQLDSGDTNTARHPAASAWRRVNLELACAKPGDFQTSRATNTHVLQPHGAVKSREIAPLLPPSIVMVYIRSKKLPGLKEYKYAGVDHSLVSRYILKPFYNNVAINCFPMSMA